MIILDTSVLRSFALDSSSAELLRTIRAADGQGVAAPWMVLEEIASQKALKYRDRHEAAAKALTELNAVTPWGPDARPPQPDLERVREHWRKEYGAIVDVIPTSETALREAAFREANLLAPCKVVMVKDRPHKTGSRDAAIWLSAVEYTRENRSEIVYFVSKNTKDFGDGSAYEHPMDEDLAGVGDRFVHLTDISDVITRFTEATEVDLEAVEAVLTSAGSLTLIAEEAKRGWSAGEGFARPEQQFGCHVIGDFGGSPGIARGWLVEPAVQFRSVRDVSAYRIGEHVWATATVRWLLAGPAFTRSPKDLVAVGCAWETRVLLSTTNADAKLTVLRSDVPVMVDEDPDEYDHLPTPPRMPFPESSGATSLQLRQLTAALRRRAIDGGDLHASLANLDDVWRTMLMFGNTDQED
ncbi:PIN domain-containing protein [Streptomyces sp. NPDC058217]|uniref:PIN domain-containing protein n=1 Tax=Streptomyces sp. NPDC058217 TaxID=3346384 RepID=UPI0036EAA8E6